MGKDYKYEFFISYRRSDGGIGYAAYLKEVLELINQTNRDVFLDVDNLTEGVFTPQIERAIEETNHFVLILTPSTFDEKEHSCFFREINKALQIQGLDRITIIKFGKFPDSFAMEDEILPECLKNKNLFSGQIRKYDNEYNDFFPKKLFKHFYQTDNFFETNNIGYGYFEFYSEFIYELNKIMAKIEINSKLYRFLVMEYNNTLFIPDFVGLSVLKDYYADKYVKTLMALKKDGIISSDINCPEKIINIKTKTSGNEITIKGVNGVELIISLPQSVTFDLYGYILSCVESENIKNNSFQYDEESSLKINNIYGEVLKFCYSFITVRQSTNIRRNGGFI